MTVEKSIISSLMVARVNRGVVALADRAFKEGYDKVKRTPHMLDTVIKAKLTAMFSEVGGKETCRKLVRFFKENESHTLSIDFKNQLIVMSKEGFDKLDLGYLDNENFMAILTKLKGFKDGQILMSHTINAYLGNYVAGTLSDEAQVWADPLTIELTECPIERFMKVEINKVIDLIDTEVKNN